MPKKRFTERSRVLSLRVPISQFDNYKKLFSSIVKKDNGTIKYDYLELLKLAIFEKDSFINLVHKTLKKSGKITLNQFTNLHKNVDMDIIREVHIIINKGVI